MFHIQIKKAKFSPGYNKGKYNEFRNESFELEMEILRKIKSLPPLSAGLSTFMLHSP